MVIVTSTGAWFRCPAAFGWVSETSTVIVAPLPDPLPEPFPGPAPDDEGDDVATFDTCVIAPGVTAPSGSVTATLSPAVTSPCSEASRAIVTTGVTDVAVSTTEPAVAGAPGTTPVPSAFTCAGPGRNTTSPSGSVPVTASPRCNCSRSSAYAVSPEK